MAAPDLGLRWGGPCGESGALTRTLLSSNTAPYCWKFPWLIVLLVIVEANLLTLAMLNALNYTPPTWSRGARSTGRGCNGQSTARAARLAASPSGHGSRCGAGRSACICVPTFLATISN